MQSIYWALFCKMNYKEQISPGWVHNENEDGNHAKRNIMQNTMGAEEWARQK